MKKAVEYIIRAKDATASGIKSALGRVKSFAAGVGRNLANIQAGLTMAMGAAQKFASVFAKAIGEAFKFEKAVTDFKVLLGNIDAAKTHIADLKTFAASTPLTFGDLSRASKLLLSFGSSVDEVMPSLKTLGDIAMGDEQRFQGLALVFAQVKSQGKLMGQDLLQMINQGFNPLTVISKQTGKSMSELKDMMAEGKISFEMVAEAMRLATSEGGLFHNAMKEASQTGEGMISTLSDNWTEAVRTFGEAFSDAAKNGVGTLSDKLKELTEDGTVEEWAERAADSVSVIAGAFQGLGSILGGIWGGIKRTVGTAMAFGAGADQAWREGKSFKEQIAAGRDVAAAYWDNEFDGGKEIERRRERRRYGSRTKKAKTATTPAEAAPQKTLSEMMYEAEAEGRKKAAAEREEARKKAEEAARKAAAAEEKERLRVEKEVARERERLRKAEMAAYRKELTAAHKAALEADTAAQSRLDAARSASQQAWGWYRDKDSLKAQLEEERAEAAAQAQFEKDFEKLRRRSDWRTAAAYGSDKMRSLSLDEEATRRVALAREEERAAEEYAKQTAKECKRSADALEAIQNVLTEGSAE